MNVIFAGKNIEFMIKKLDCAKIVGIILFPKLLIVLILREIWYFIGKKGGSLTWKFFKSKRESIKSSRERKNINTQEEKRNLLFSIIDVL